MARNCRVIPRIAIVYLGINLTDYDPRIAVVIVIRIATLLIIGNHRRAVDIRPIGSIGFNLGTRTKSNTE